jgi:NAD+ synthase (glutamine-hydrolysing)
MTRSRDYSTFGFVRTAAVAPALALGDPATNATRLAELIDGLAREGVTLAVFPELALTGYTCEDLFLTSALQRAARQALLHLAAATAHAGIVSVVGAPWPTADGRLLNAAVVLAGGQVRGVVPKTYQPNYGEYYERRWFASGAAVDETVDEPPLGRFRVHRDQLFRIGYVRFGIEICEDLWAPESPGIPHCLAGADLIVNPSASNELVAKADYRRDLVRMTSARGLCGYLYAASGPLESTKDMVCGGHLLAAENGHLLGESRRFAFTTDTLIAEFDVERVRHDRMQNATFGAAPRRSAYPVTHCLDAVRQIAELARPVDPHPFVPADEREFDAHAAEILEIQATGLARRMHAIGTQGLVLGVSGGLDSTLAFLVCLDALAKLGMPRSTLHAVTMPGPGTTGHTRDSALRLCSAAGVDVVEIPIDAAVHQHLADLDHTTRNDLVFENAQARERTQILFDYANKVRGIVVGTGDLSELALGWCTYNADHMANYNVNASVPKTMMAYLVRWYAQHRADTALADVLARVLATPISPELLEPAAGTADLDAVVQATESIIGPYELHDFFLFHYLRHGAGPEKIFALARIAFADRYDATTLQRWLKVFFQRFFSQQFKRTTLPPGPKVGTVSLSPRGDWRMPDEASAAGLLATIDALPLE